MVVTFSIERSLLKINCVSFTVHLQGLSKRFIYFIVHVGSIAVHFNEVKYSIEIYQFKIIIFPSLAN